MENLPLEMLEVVLLRPFVVVFGKHYKSTISRAGEMTYNALAAVCNNWWQTMNGWPQSTTKHWFRHELKRQIAKTCRPFFRRPIKLPCPHLKDSVCGLALVGDRLFVATYKFYGVRVFGPDNNELPSIAFISEDIIDADKKQPEYEMIEMIACSRTKKIYVGEHLVDRDENDCHSGRIRVVDIDSGCCSILPVNSSVSFCPDALSLRSNRLLITSSSCYMNDDFLLLVEAESGDELKRISSPDVLKLFHGVETSRGTYVVSHNKPLCRICEIDADCQVLRSYDDQQRMSYNYPLYLAIDADDRIFVAQYSGFEIWLLNSQLEHERILLTKYVDGLLESPSQLCYVNETGKLAIGSLWRTGLQLQVFQVR